LSDALIAAAPAAPEFSDDDMSQTLEAMRRVFSRRFGKDGPALSLDQDLASLGMDSLAFIDYAFELEDELHLSLPDLPRDLVTVRDLARFVHAEFMHKAEEAAAK
jgi:acyl carrier protein